MNTNDELENPTLTDANSVSPEVLPKTRKCDWCKKRKIVEHGYWLGKFEGETKCWFICVKCNLEHDVV